MQQELVERRRVERALRESEERFRHDAMHDPLTRLPNRTYFMDQLRRALERCKRRAGYQAAVLFMDLDRFKVVNDSLGHTIGDQMLVDIARRLEKYLRAGDMIARFGGDEFAILLDDIVEVQDAIHIADRIQEGLALPFSLQNHEYFTSASIGIALTTSVYELPEDMLRDADTAMYQAKAAGRARYQIFDSLMHAQSMALLRLEADLRRAIERKEFILYFQPILSIQSGKITSLEALVRWQPPERELVSPLEFIGLAEETGLIVPLGEWVLNSACTQAKAWHDLGFPHLHIAINLSARQLQDPHLPALVRSVLEKTGLPAQALQLEITESAAMRDFNLTVKSLKEFKDMGVHLSIDDFGTSYSSLEYLKRFPVSSIKIDRSFIHDLTEDIDDAAIVTAIIAMGHILNLSLIAEGVETREQLMFLISQSCDECQGFLLFPPLPAEQVAAVLAGYRDRDLIRSFFPA